MPKKKVPRKTGTKKSSDALSTGEQIYNAIMVQIEPELLSTSAAALDDQYEDETDAEYKQRMKHYSEAFALYDQCFGAYVVSVIDEAKKTKFAARRDAESKTRAEEEQVEEDILSKIKQL